MNKFLKGLLIGIGIFLFVLFIGITFIFPAVLKMRVSRVGANAANPKFPVRKYSEKVLRENYGIDHLKYSEREIDGITCKWYRVTGTNRVEPEDYLEYYIFANERDAKDALESMREWLQDDVTDSGLDYVEGWERGVMDASIYVYLYRSKNMIVQSEAVFGSFADTTMEEAENNHKAIQDRFDMNKRFIDNNFGE